MRIFFALGSSFSFLMIARKKLALASLQLWLARFRRDGSCSQMGAVLKIAAL
jgi:hypothetical protein